MSKKVQVLYDFQAESDGELTATTGEVLTVLDAETFDGWILVLNQYGTQGIVPSSYVEYLEDSSSSLSSAPSNPLPPPPSMTMSSSPQFTSAAYQMPTPYQNTNTTTAANYDAFQPTLTTTSTSYNTQKSGSFNDYDDFDDDDDDEPPSRPQTLNNYSSSSTSNAINIDSTSTLQRNSLSNMQTLSASQNVGTLRHKPKNIFGLDAFLLTGPIKQVNESEKIAAITLDNQGQAQWVRKSQPYRISIPKTTSGKKYHGLKEYTTYVLTTSLFNNEVSRRYKQFDWLHERLLDKYPNVCIPPLPDKVVTGRFEEEFIKKRQRELEVWLNRMSLHPIVNQSEIFIYFLQCKDGEVAKWKDFKRKSEKHEYRGAQWLCTVNVPAIAPGTTTEIKRRIDDFVKSSNNLDVSMKNVMQGVDKLAGTHTNVYRKEIAFMGKKFEELGNCMCAMPLSTVNTPNNTKLSVALIDTGKTYTDIANMYNEQARFDAQPLLEQLAFYRGLCQQMPEIVSFNKNAIQIVEELQQKQDREVVNISEIMTRLDVVNYATLSEINYFNGQKINDFNTYMRNYLTKQIEFYSEITDRLQKTLVKYEVPQNNYND